jgi:hypothetical protein
MYTHKSIQEEADRLHALIVRLEGELEAMGDELEFSDAFGRTYVDDAAEQIQRRLDRAERELESLSAIDHDPAAHGFGFAGDL